MHGMKPTFALNFTETSIALLHRATKGWVQVGETPFDSPDLTEALDYLRATALGLAPGGFTTKLVIPNSQLLYAEIEAPGPSEAERRAQITAALEARTSLTAEDMVFDWSGKGKTVKVVAVDRQTLDEAEDFATQHRFDPVSFVAIPEPGTFSGEPWFGPAGAAVDLPADKAAALRDRTAISIIDSPRGAAKPAKAAAPVVSPEPAAEVWPDADSALAFPEEFADFETEDLVEPPAPDAAPAAVADAVAETAPDTVPGLVTEDVSAPDQGRLVAPEAEAETDEVPAIEVQETDVLPEIAAAPVKDETPAPAMAAPEEDRTFPALADGDVLPVEDIPPPAVADPAPVAPAAEDSLPAEAAEETPAVEPVFQADTMAPARDEAPRAAPDNADEAALSEPALVRAVPDPLPEVEEAPFTHVADSTAFPEDEAPRAPTGAAKALPEDDDLPPAPSPAALAAFSSRRGVDADSRPRTVPPLTAPVRPDAAALARAARGKPVDELPPMPRPPQAAPRPGLTGARSPAERPAMPLVTAPSIPGTRKAKGKPQPAAPAPLASAVAATAAASPADAARSLGRSPFANRPRRGAPRYLGLVLTAILLICLALVAAWSSFYLASDDSDPAATNVAADSTAIEDEMLADGEDPDALAAETPAADVAADTALQDPAPEGTDTGDLAAAETAGPAPTATTGADQAPAASVLVDPQDEIFLSGADAPPPAFDALALPTVDTAADALPQPPMPPPAFGTVYRFDANGQVVPTPDGIVSPEGVMLFAGKPPRVPPARSAVAEAAAQAAVAAAATAAAAPAATDAAGTAPALTEGQPAADAPAAPETAAAPAAEQPNPDLADRKPRARPEGLTPPADAGDDAALETVSPTDVTSLRPRVRPASVVAAGEQARAETAAASLAAPAAEAAPTTELAAADAANPSLLTISRRPSAKPRDFSRAVEAAVAAAVRTPEPEPEPTKASAAVKAAPALKPEEQEEADVPEVASAAPKIPTKASVAKQATYVNALNLSKTNLIGVYGTQSNRYALVRMSNGKYKKVRVGDRIDGGTVQAITQSEVRYQKGGRLVALKMPKG